MAYMAMSVDRAVIIKAESSSVWKITAVGAVLEQLIASGAAMSITPPARAAKMALSSFSVLTRR